MINNYRDPLCFWREWEVRVNSLWPCIPYEHGEEDFKVKEKFNFIETSIFHKHMEIMYSWNRYRAINTGLPKFLFLLLSSLRKKKETQEWWLMGIHRKPILRYRIQLPLIHEIQGTKTRWWLETNTKLSLDTKSEEFIQFQQSSSSMLQYL